MKQITMAAILLLAAVTAQAQRVDFFQTFAWKDDERKTPAVKEARRRGSRTVRRRGEGPAAAGD